LFEVSNNSELPKVDCVKQNRAGTIDLLFHISASHRF